MQRRILLNIAAIGMALTACNRGEQKTETPAAPPPPNVVTFTATEYSFAGPDTIPAGVTTIRLANAGTEAHHLSLMKLTDGKTLQDVMALPPSDTAPSWVVAVGGPNAATPGDTVTATSSLDPGHYVMMCFIPSPDGKPHFMKGMIRSLEVIAGSGPAAAEPVADITLKLVEYGFEFSTPVTPGRHTIRVEDGGAQPHEIVIVRLEPGKTMQEWMAWTETMAGPPPGQVINGVAGMNPGIHAFVEDDFTPGDYGLVCFVGDAKDGRPHFLHGMMQQISVK